MAPSQRRRSIDSSSSSSEFSPNAHDQTQSGSHTDPLKAGGYGGSADARGHHEPPPPSYSPPSASTAQPGPQVPPSGYRIPLGTPGPPFPGIERTREAPFTDADGKTPVFIGSALMQDSVHPCKIAPKHQQPCYVSYGGKEVVHQGRYDLLPFVPALMEFVPTSHGRVPPGRRPVKGGFEQGGQELYHAVAAINGTKVPGKTGTHLGGCNIPYGGQEHVVRQNYEILCWRF
ncbi:hypothetical protein BJV77DRAFT_209743 [Russula vinacea]|nr:hypothetical protein BJV77DRAFT_209743 [Russula vinacea]